MAPERQRAVAWHRLLDDLWEHRALLAADICARMQERLSVYPDLPVERFFQQVASAMETTIRLAPVDPPRLSSAQTTTLEQVGEAQAQIGIPVDQMLLAWRIGVDRLVEHGSSRAAGLGLDAQQMLDFTRAVLAASDVGMADTARAHRRADLERDREAQDRRATFVRAVLFGTGDPGELRARMKSYGLDPARRYHAVRARPVAGGYSNTVARAIGLVHATEAGRGMSVVVDGDVAGFQLDRPGDATPALVGFGPPVPLDRLADSFRLATRALHTLEAFGLAGTRDLGELGLRAAVVADADVGAALRRRYLDPLVGAGSGGEIISSLREYLAGGAHVETAAERLHVHPNTLRYRLARFEELTSVRLRDPLVAFEVWWALESAAIQPS